MQFGSNCTVIYTSSWVATNSDVGSVINLGGAFGIGTVVGIAVDLTARLAWFRLGAANWNNSGQLIQPPELVG